MKGFGAVLVVGLLSGCGGPESGVVHCVPSGQEVTGDLAVDLLGYWRCDEDGEGQVICALNPDSTMDHLIDGTSSVGKEVVTWSVAEDQLLLQDEFPGDPYGDVVFNVLHMDESSVDLEFLKNSSTGFAWARHWTREDCTLP